MNSIRPPRFKSHPRRFSDNPRVLSEILSLAFWMKKQGYTPSTITSCVRTLKAVAKRANLQDPEAVKTLLASSNVSVGRKEKNLPRPSSIRRGAEKISENYNVCSYADQNDCNEFQCYSLSIYFLFQKFRKVLCY